MLLLVATALLLLAIPGGLTLCQQECTSSEQLLLDSGLRGIPFFKQFTVDRRASLTTQFSSECDRVLDAPPEDQVVYEYLHFLFSTSNETSLEFPLGFQGFFVDNYEGGGVSARRNSSSSWQPSARDSANQAYVWVNVCGQVSDTLSSAQVPACSDSVCYADTDGAVLGFGRLDSLRVTAYDQHAFAPWFGVVLEMEGSSDCPGNPGQKAKTCLTIVPDLSAPELHNRGGKKTSFYIQGISQLVSSELQSCTLDITINTGSAFPNVFCESFLQNETALAGCPSNRPFNRPVCTWLSRVSGIYIDCSGRAAFFVFLGAFSILTVMFLTRLIILLINPQVGILYHRLSYFFGTFTALSGVLYYSLILGAIQSRPSSYYLAQQVFWYSLQGGTLACLISVPIMWAVILAGAKKVQRQSKISSLAIAVTAAIGLALIVVSIVAPFIPQYFTAITAVQLGIGVLFTLASNVVGWIFFWFLRSQRRKREDLRFKKSTGKMFGNVLKNLFLYLVFLSIFLVCGLIIGVFVADIVDANDNLWPNVVFAVLEIAGQLLFFWYINPFRSQAGKEVTQRTRGSTRGSRASTLGNSSKNADNSAASAMDDTAYSTQTHDADADSGGFVETADTGLGAAAQGEIVIEL